MRIGERGVELGDRIRRATADDGFGLVGGAVGLRRCLALPELEVTALRLS